MGAAALTLSATVVKRRARAAPASRPVVGPQPRMEECLLPGLGAQPESQMWLGVCAAGGAEG